MFKNFKWDEHFLTGNEELDDYHERIFELLQELLKMFEDTKTYKNKIPAKTDEFVSVVLEHLDVESSLLEKYNIPNYKEHIEAHKEIKERINTIRNYDIPSLLKAITIGDIICEYFLEHFQMYDKVQLCVLNKKICDEKKKIKLKHK